jgi:Kef-type K+ transport system membrane component KefB
MKLKNNPLFYLLTIGGAVLIIAFILHSGKNLSLPSSRSTAPSMHVGNQNNKNNFYPLATFILQIAVIILAARVFGWLFGKLGQPAVMGEIIAGILLGPSALGALTPAINGFIFPPASIGNLQIFSQIGLILFMFVVGMELDLEILRKNAGSALLISHASIVIPFALGCGLSYFLYSILAPPDIPFFAFALFMGIAMSITAFPVLSRIIRERGLSHSRLGQLALTCAALDDITAWCLLAIVLAIIRNGNQNSLSNSLFLLPVYVLAMLFIIRPLLKKLLDQATGEEKIGRSRLTVIFIILLLSAYCTELIGIHALFGAFAAGIVMPAEKEFRIRLADKIEDIALVLLLPLFFVVTGLRTTIGLLDNPSLWVILFLILAVAVIGKFGAAAISAKLMGESLKDSLSIGALMNTRGLVELVVLNIGYDLHIISPAIFTMMVLMALITTCMTNPALNLINKL